MSIEETKTREWSNLPTELLECIADRAGLFELPSICLVCKAWYSACSTTLAHIVKPELNQGAWFLLYEDKSSQCQLITASGRKFTTSLPELVGTTCLATYQAWLLLFKGGCASMFFFQPFSRQRIDLPGLPLAELADHRFAAVSCPPTFKDCMVCVINCRNIYEWDANLLYLGNQAWVGTQCNLSHTRPNTIKCAVYENQTFRFYDIVLGRHMRTMLVIYPDGRFAWNKPSKVVGRYVPQHFRDQKIHRDLLIFVSGKNELKKKLKDMKNKLRLTEDVVSTCGTFTQLDGKRKLIFNERLMDPVDQSFNGVWTVWIQPRFSISTLDDEAHAP